MSVKAVVEDVYDGAAGVVITSYVEADDVDGVVVMVAVGRVVVVEGVVVGLTVVVGIISVWHRLI